MAEASYSVLFSVPWSIGIDAHREPDFDPDIEVRCRDGWRNIIVRDRDAPKADRRFVAAVHEDGLFRFYGWCWGHEALRFPLSDPTGYGRPARFIPVEVLHRLPMEARHEDL